MLELVLSALAHAAIMFCCTLCLYLLCTGGSAQCLKDDIKTRNYGEVFSTLTMAVIVAGAWSYQAYNLGLAVFKLLTPIMRNLMIGGGL
ncbi:TMhelix containing protein [Vibrio phage 1.215.B._10N.222.54.F7]|nr:TMhelix containing protein [Vibrio phage 1.215.A._10N.222.54.F7]AUR96042.1 TMhelix containing protein [Vibrio phage 1.215.B._10N.222.54.F7]